MSPRALLLPCVVALAPFAASGQAAPGTPHVKLDLAASQVNGIIPFDQPFQLVGSPSPQLQQIYFWYGETSVATPLSCADINHQLNAPRTLHGDSGLRFKVRAIFNSIKRTPEKVASVDTASALLPKWNRKGIVSDSFRLAVDALEPNRDFGFCFRTVSSLTTADSTAFFGRIQRNLKTAALKDVASSDPADSPARFHQAIIAALPPGDTLIIPAGTFLAKDALPADVAKVFADYTTANNNRLRIASALDTAAAAELSGTADHLAQTLVALGRADGVQTFARLAAGTDTKVFPNAAGLSVAAGALLRLPALVADDSTLQLNVITEVALGRRSLSALATPPAKPDRPSKLSTSADVAPWAANMSQTLATLGSLQDFTVFLQAPGAVPTTTGLTAGMLDTLQRLIRRAVYQTQEQAERLDQISGYLDDLDKEGNSLMNGVTAAAVSTIGISGTTFGDYKTRASWRIGQDAGFLITGGSAQQVVPYLGLNIYFRPVNRSVHTPCPTYTTFWRCVSLTIGVTTSNFQETGRYAGVLSGKAVILGAGTRIGDFFRVSLLCPMVYRSTNGNARPQQFGIRTGVGLSIDADLLDLVAKVGKALFP